MACQWASGSARSGHVLWAAGTRTMGGRDTYHGRWGMEWAPGYIVGGQNASLSARVPQVTHVLSPSTPGSAGVLSARYMHTGDPYKQVFPQMNLQVPVKVPGLVESPTTCVYGMDES